MQPKIKLHYVTYQTFPSKKANTLQTIGNLKYLSKNNVDSTLIFPLRKHESSSNESTLKKVYNYEVDIKIRGISHKFPFGKTSKFERLFFLMSHFLWSRQISRSIMKKSEEGIIFFTRSEWVFYYLSKYDLKVTYECHQLSKLKKIIIPISIKKPASKIIFLNEELKIDAKIKKVYDSKIQILHNGVDEELFKTKVQKDRKRVIFSGNLSRFNTERNLDFIIQSFADPKLSDFNLSIVGANESEFALLNKNIEQLGLSERISVEKWVDREQSIKRIQKSSIGILINSENNLHSTKYTSPLKYFEYVYAGLSVVAVDFKAHRVLPNSESISFFKNNDKSNFINAILNASSSSFSSVGLNEFTLDYRAKQIIDFIKY
ncbi:glycosyltransferase [Acidimicrobiia bacterium]|nr:glycosyltransferase [Acidimicrobiia bacterium]